jgi:hypothetical protein
MYNPGGMQKMRWSRVIGCGLLAATHHTGRVKFRIAKCECKFAKVERQRRGATVLGWKPRPLWPG